MKTYTIALDMNVEDKAEILHGRHGKRVVGQKGIDHAARGAAMALQDHPDLELLIIGDNKDISSKEAGHRTPRLEQALITGAEEVGIDYNDIAGRFRIIHAPRIIRPGQKGIKDIPFTELMETSVYRTIETLTLGTPAQAAVTCTDTGAVLNLASMKQGESRKDKKPFIPMIEGIDMATLCAPFPSQGRTGYTLVLDIGGLAVSSPLNYLHNAVMASALLKSQERIRSRPKVGLVNIGKEAKKGDEFLRFTDLILRKYVASTSQFDYLGFVEGNDIFTDPAKDSEHKPDIVLVSGMAGNIMLKAIEGFGRFIKGELGTAAGSGYVSKAAAGIFFKATGGGKRFTRRITPEAYGGAYILGYRKLIIKGHGASSDLAIHASIGKAYQAVSHDYIPTAEDYLRRWGTDAVSKRITAEAKSLWYLQQKLRVMFNKAYEKLG
ncbi:hypothetical protein JXB02_01895 [Candidatus Woesearchaeota archaeon]|nr:hypothetical protein [Candidatus Woesearchaeota archaeon]